LDDAGIERFRIAGIDPPERKLTKKEKRIRIEKPDPTVSGISMMSSTSSRQNRMKRKKAAVVRQCFEKQLRVNPHISGKLTVAIVLKENGRVKEVIIEKNSTENEELGDCVKSRFLNLRFPRTEGGEATIRHNFQLQSGQ